MEKFVCLVCGAGVPLISPIMASRTIVHRVKKKSPIGFPGMLAMNITQGVSRKPKISVLMYGKIE